MLKTKCRWGTFLSTLAHNHSRIPHPLLMTGGAKVSTLTGKSEKILVVAVSTFHAGKAVVQIAAIEITVNDIQEIGTEESVGPLESFLVDPDEGFQMILDAPIIAVFIHAENICRIGSFFMFLTTMSRSGQASRSKDLI